jgi:Iron only hydrogenase large subunit, C-terminal domain
MRGFYTPVTKIRRQVFTEIAKLAYSDTDLSYIEQLPFKIIPGQVAMYRDSVFIERAIVGERLRLAMGLPLRNMTEPQPVANGIEECAIPEKFYEPPLVNVISFACNACKNGVEVSEKCQGCLAHPCTSVCPVKAVSIVNGKSHIDPDKCIKCGRCVDNCPYNAIVKFERPCAKACGMDAIESDELGRAKINYDKCVSCGMCLANCPFAAIADKSQIFQLITAIKNGEEIIAAIAPAFVGQFGPLATPEKVFAGIQKLGFSEVYEVAIGADIGAVTEAHHFAHKVATEEEPFLATSCCPSWSMMAKKLFPDLAPYVSSALTPMVATARIIKKEHPNAKIVFIGPCAAKKLEAQRRSVRSDVDFVITFEELMGMFIAKDVDFGDIGSTEPIDQATSNGRGYAISKGVTDAIVQQVHELYPDMQINTDHAEGLKECRKMLTLAKAGKRNGYLLEGMGCPGGCVAGAGTILPINKAQVAVGQFKSKAEKKSASENSFMKDAPTE